MSQEITLDSTADIINLGFELDFIRSEASGNYYRYANYIYYYGRSLHDFMAEREVEDGIYKGRLRLRDYFPKNVSILPKYDEL